VQIQSSYQGTGACLYVCSTPIGNLEDVTFRLIQVLSTVSVIAAEDTRQTRKLLTRYDIHPDLLVSYHEHNARSRRQDLQQWWEAGKSVAIVSDAGTPGVSDPGADAIEWAIERGIPVIPIPGPSAVMTALVGSGVVPQPFLFLGFLPRAEKDAKKTLQVYARTPATLVLYEAPHRLRRSMAVICDVFPGRFGALAKELTKRHETFIRGSVEELFHYTETEAIRGEFVIVIGPPAPAESFAEADNISEAERMRQAHERVALLMQSGTSHAEAVRLTAAEFRVRRKALYQATLR
jgi:16S rRNA (cytidine1402-2'-O)-methyltransferase